MPRLLLATAMLLAACTDATPGLEPCDCAADIVCDPVKGACYCPTSTGAVAYVCEPEQGREYPACGDLAEGCAGADACDGVPAGGCWCYVPDDGTAYACVP